MAEILECTKCGEPFSLTDTIGGNFQRDWEDIDCPHCRGVSGKRKTAGVLISSPLSAEEKRKYQEEKASKG